MNIGYGVEYFLANYRKREEMCVNINLTEGNHIKLYLQLSAALSYDKSKALLVVTC